MENSLSSYIVLPSPEKSPNDKKEYKSIQLSNGLKATLISDPRKWHEDDIHNYEEANSLSDEIETDSEEETAVSDDEVEENECETSRKRTKTSYQIAEKYQAAVALCVRAGSFEDPDEIPGLMHFLEHMVFMGSEKYPKENFFSSFIKNHGGCDNAETTWEHTTFHFSVQEKNLYEALERFAQIFICPLMKQEAMTRERKAVHSEFQAALPNDEARTEQLFTTLAAVGHPMGKFFWGNEKTLCLDISDSELHQKLHELRLKYYSSHYMALAIQSRFPLDRMEEWICRIFSSVPNNSRPFLSYDHFGFPFPPESVHCMFKVIPVKEYHSMEICWALPPQQQFFKTKPYQYVGHLLGHEGLGSILSYLKKRAWAVGLASDNGDGDFEFNSTCSKLTISIQLTDSGFRHTEDVLLVVFQFLHMLRNRLPDENVFREIQLVQKIEFEYGEEMTPEDNVEFVAESMLLHSSEYYLTGRSLIFEYSEQDIMNYLEALDPSKCNIMLSSKNFEHEGVCNQTELWFGTRYALEEIPSKWVERWSDPPANPELHIPPLNPFVPDSFGLLSKTCPKEHYPEYPVCVKRDPYGELWYKQDAKFGLPRAYCYVNLMISCVKESPKLAAMQDLFVNLFQHHIMEEIYQATAAEYVCNIYCTERGIIILLSGFNQKLPKLLELLLSHIEHFERNFDVDVFHEMKQQQLKSYLNVLTNPNSWRKELRLSVLQETGWNSCEKLLSIKDVTSEEFLESFVATMFNSFYVQMLVQGNMSNEEAVLLFDKIVAKRNPLSSPISFMEMNVRVIPPGSHVLRVKGLNCADTNSSIISYYQHGPGNLWSELINEFIFVVMEEPVFDCLRTKEQLAYEVYCTHRNTYGILALSITVNSQANKVSEDYVDSCIQSFLEQFICYLRSMSDEELKVVKETLLSVKNTVDLSLKEEVDRNWAEIVAGEFVFNRLQKHSELIPGITREAAAEYLEKLVLPDENPQHRKLAVQVLGSKDPENGVTPSVEDILELSTSNLINIVKPSSDSSDARNYILNFNDFKQSLEIFPVTKIRS